MQVPLVDLRALDQDELLMLSRSSREEVVLLPGTSPESEGVSMAKGDGEFDDAEAKDAVDFAEEAVLTKYLMQLQGNWVSSSRKEKLVSAKGCPDGWTCRVGLSFKEGRCFLNFHSYASPNGQTWPSFKAAAAHLTSQLGHQNQLLEEDAGQPTKIEGAEMVKIHDFESGTEISCKAEEEDHHAGNGVIETVKIDDNTDVESGSSQEDSDGNTNHHPKSEEGGFKCEFCNRAFLRKSLYLRHQGTHAEHARSVQMKLAEVSRQYETSPARSSFGEKELNDPLSSMKEEEQQQERDALRDGNCVVSMEAVFCRWCGMGFRSSSARQDDAGWVCPKCDFN